MTEHVCPDCKNTFLQPFRCTTCGAQKLYDATLANAERDREALRKKNERLRAALDEIELAACTATPDDQAFAEILRIVREARQKAEGSKP